MAASENANISSTWHQFRRDAWYTWRKNVMIPRAKNHALRFPISNNMSDINWFCPDVSARVFGERKWIPIIFTIVHITRRGENVKHVLREWLTYKTHLFKLLFHAIRLHLAWIIFHSSKKKKKNLQIKSAREMKTIIKNKAGNWEIVTSNSTWQLAKT